ncbi:MAG: hypothetical protein WCQ50_03080 [Spirochaetota bacterium]
MLSSNIPHRAQARRKRRGSRALECSGLPDNRPNRFVASIRSGDIETIEDLKAAFRERALVTHPDLAGPATEDGAFIAVRSEYEAALANFERHRFGARVKSPGPGGAREFSPGSTSTGSGGLWACLALLLKRGFPKEPRHEKEGLRYAYALWRFRRALRTLDAEGEALASFDAAAAPFLELGNSDKATLKLLRNFLGELIDYASRGLPVMRVALVRELDTLGAARILAAGPCYPAFLFAKTLAAALGIGPTLA